MSPQDNKYTNQMYDPNQTGPVNQQTPPQQPATQPPQYPGLDYMPSAPGSAEIPVVPETAPEIPENNLEFQPIAEVSKPVQSSPYPVPQDQPAPKPVPITEPMVVNKATYKERLHAVNPQADAITTLADKEEEKFITEVEKHHLKS